MWIFSYYILHRWIPGGDVPWQSAGPHHPVSLWPHRDRSVHRQHQMVGRGCSRVTFHDKHRRHSTGIGAGPTRHVVQSELHHPQVFLPVEGGNLNGKEWITRGGMEGFFLTAITFSLSFNVEWERRVIQPLMYTGQQYYITWKSIINYKETVIYTGNSS